MCLIAVSLQQCAQYPFLLIANRDEFYSRPTRRAMFWPNHPDILAGCDELAGGTWLGVDRRGRFAAVTNFRDPRLRRPGARSRGTLVSSFLMERTPAATYLHEVHTARNHYNRFNLLLGDESGVFYYSSVLGDVRALQEGLYGLSNHNLDTPWPKVQKAKRGLSRVLRKRASLQLEDLFQLLADTEIAADPLLPDTGVGLGWERTLSAVFVGSPAYGTRSSTVIVLDSTGELRFAERSFDAQGGTTETYEYRLKTQAVCQETKELT